MPDLTTTFSFTLEVDSLFIASFRKCSGVEAETETVEYKEMANNGRMIIRKVPGAMKWSDITFERRIDETRKLWEWRQQVEQGDIDKARRNGSIVIKDSMGKEVGRWNFRAGWPSKWTGAELDAGANEVATEKLVITHEGLERTR
jgi:phage tail-like protein